jgi:hypothetical protein
MKKLLILLLAAAAWAEVPYTIPAKVEIERLPALLNRNFEELDMKIDRLDVRETQKTEEEEEEEAVTPAKKTWARDIRTEQFGNLDDDDVQGQLFELDEEKLHRKAVKKKYLTVESTSTWWSDGTTDNAEIHGTTGRSQFRGSMIHYSTNSYWTTGGTKTIQVDGYVDESKYESENKSNFVDNFSVYPDTITNWVYSEGNSNVVTYSQNGWFYANCSDGSDTGNMHLSRRISINTSTTILKVATQVDFFEDYSADTGFGHLLGIKYYADTRPEIGFMEYNNYLRFYYKDGNYEQICPFPVGSRGTLEIEHLGTTVKYTAIVSGVEYTGEHTTNLQTACVPYFHLNNNVGGTGYYPYFFAWNYYAENTFSSSTILSVDLATIKSISAYEESNRGLGINVGNNDVLFSSDGGVAIYNGGLKSYPAGINQGADGGKLAIYTDSTAGVDFYVGGSTYPQNITYNGSEIGLSTTTRIAGDLHAEDGHFSGNHFVAGYSSTTGNSYAEDIYGSNAIITSSVTAKHIVLDNVHLTSDNFGLQVSSNMYVAGKSSATYFYGDGSNLTNLPQVSTATYAYSAGTATYADNSGLLNGHGTAYFATASDLSDIAASTGTIYSALQSTGSALSALTDRVYNTEQATGTLLTKSSATATYMNVAERNNYLTSPATFTYVESEVDPVFTSSAPATYLGVSAKAADSDLLDGKDSTAFAQLDATQTFTGQNTFNNSVDLDNNILGGLNLLNSKQEATYIDFNDENIKIEGLDSISFLTSDSTGGNIILSDNLKALQFQTETHLDMNNNYINNLDTTPLTGYATAKEYVDYKDTFKLDESSATVTYMNVSERDNYLTSPATFTYVESESDPIFISSAPATYLEKTNKAADSDKLDGLDSLDFIKKDGSVAFTGQLTGALDIGTTLDVTGAATLDDKLGIGGTAVQKLDIFNGNMGITNSVTTGSEVIYLTGDNGHHHYFTRYNSAKAGGLANNLYLKNYNGSVYTTIMSFLENGNVGVSTTTPITKLSVAGTITADAYVEYSKKYEGDAFTKIKDIKAKSGEEGDWRSVDHDTLPDGVREEIQYQKKWKKDKATGEMVEEWRVDADTTTYNGEYDSVTTTETFVGRNLGNSVQFNLRAIQQLVEKVEALEARIEELEMRIAAIEEK